MSRYYIEFEKWNNLNHQEKIRQATLAYREERLGVELSQMVSPYPLIRKKNGSFNYTPDPNAQFAREENATTNNTFELIKDGCNIVFWFSPRGGGYPDGRLTVAIPEKIEGGDIYLDCRGMPLHWQSEEMLSMAEKIISRGGKTKGILRSPESLRSQPIGIKYNGDWTEFCKEVLGMDNLWNYIRWEKDLAEVGQLEQVVEKAYLEANGDSVKFERIMRGWGYLLNPIGNHGGSHIGNEFGVVSFKMQLVNGMSIVEPIKKNNKNYCPICGKEIGDGVKVCPKCFVGIKQ